MRWCKQCTSHQGCTKLACSGNQQNRKQYGRSYAAWLRPSSSAAAGRLAVSASCGCPVRLEDCSRDSHQGIISRTNRLKSELGCPIQDSRSAIGRNYAIGVGILPKVACRVSSCSNASDGVVRSKSENKIYLLPDMQILNFHQM